VLSVTTAMIEEYKHMLSKRLANGTVNLYLRTLSPVFTFAASPRLGWIPRSPFQDVRLLPVKGRMMWLYSTGHTETRAIVTLERCVR
jgi:hypothetical protein